MVPTSACFSIGGGEIETHQLPHEPLFSIGARRSRDAPTAAASTSSQHALVRYSRADGAQPLRPGPALALERGLWGKAITTQTQQPIVSPMYGSSADPVARRLQPAREAPAQKEEAPVPPTPATATAATAPTNARASSRRRARTA